MIHLVFVRSLKMWRRGNGKWIVRLSNSSQKRQNNRLAAARANPEARSGKSASFVKQGANAAETTSSAGISAFFLYSCIVFKSSFTFRPTSHRSGIFEIIENLLEMPERRNEPLLIFSMDSNEGHTNPQGEDG